MIKYMTAISTLVLVFLLTACGGSIPAAGDDAGSGPKPAWLINHPVDPQYYIGIGSAAKALEGANALRSAQDLALADLAAQISVTISSDILTTLIEAGDLTQETYLATARSQAVADLEGHEFVGSWQDADYQYAYYRLSKSIYAEQQFQKRRAAKALSLDYLRQARAARELGNFSDALNASMQGFIPLLPYLNEALEVDIGGHPVVLGNEYYQLIQSLLSDIRIVALQPMIRGKLGQALPENILVKAFWADNLTIHQLPLSAKFIKGSGSLTESVNTGNSGMAKISVLAVTSPLVMQMVEIRVDTTTFLTAELSPVLKAILRGAPKPRTQVTIQVDRPTIYLSVDETFNGKTLPQTQVEPLVKNHFVAEGFHFVEDPAQADWQLELSAAALAGTEYSGLFTAFATVNLSLRERTSGEELYKNSLKRVKGIDLNYQSAANKALSEAALQLNANIIPEILESLR